MKMNAKRVQKLREAAYRGNMELVKYGLVVATFGNASGIDRELGLIAIKPSGVDYDKMTARDMVLLDLGGKKIEGDLNPSSDTKTHVALYQAFPDIGGVVHTHSKYATAWAEARRPLPCLGTTHADYFHGEVPCTALITDTQISMDYEEETAVQIIEAFRGKNYAGMPAVLVASHGPFCWGKDPSEAAYHGFMLEYSAEMAFIAVTLNRRIKGIKKTLLDKHYLRKHGPKAYYGQRGH
jgi:L-ribulose-5-phosphate 4-epimerase